ncbi:relaxase/mobilization nuclease domain-containing protein [Ruegeria arenilitoris]|uniref:relaxase/mobilization nuclease domain-containing protein n=1 Tax=Ruegeria arenilitoris TaxID=1173585 RepID=UPI001481A447|nr:relaxase/mobilization nuclease domain-containing protein [Ruegeria arenilitoris]
MTMAALDLTAADLFELAFREAQKGIDQSRRADVQLQTARRMKFLISRASSIKARLGAVFGKPEAVVKIVRKGGVKNAQELRRQINYLTVRAEGVLDIRDNGVTPLDGGQVGDLIESWADGFSGKTNYGYTRHMIVSFPEGTYAHAAHEAGLEFAERVFGSGDFGDTWDYLTVFHNDTENPHVHLVVNCRGVDHGHWLKTGMTSEMNIDRLRSIQVEVAEQFGIELAATTRLERGLRQEVETDTWKVQAGMSVIETTPDIETKAREAAGDVMALSIARMSDLFDARANAVKEKIEEFAIQLIEGDAPVVSRLEYLLNQANHFDDYGEPGGPSYVSRPIMDALEQHLRLGEDVETLDPDLKAQVIARINDVRNDEQSHPHFSALADIAGDSDFQTSDDYVTASSRYVRYMQDHLGEDAFVTLQEQTTEILKSIDNMEGLAREVEDPGLRAAMDVQIGELKGEVADLRPYDADLQAFTIEDSRYTTSLSAAALDALDPTEADKWLAVREEIVGSANSIGLNGNAFLARYNDNETVTLGTTMAWRSADISSAAAHLRNRGVPDSYQQAEAVVGELHQVASRKIAEVAQEIVHAREHVVQSREDDGHSL